MEKGCLSSMESGYSAKRRTKFYVSCKCAVDWDALNSVTRKKDY